MTTWIKRLDEWVDRHNIKSSELCKIIDGVEQQIKDAEEKIEKLKKALEFYANDENWHVITIEDDSEDTTCLCTISIKDNEERFSYEGMAGGKLARKVLKEIEG